MKRMFGIDIVSPFQGLDWLAGRGRPAPPWAILSRPLGAEVLASLHLRTSAYPHAAGILRDVKRG